MLHRRNIVSPRPFVSFILLMPSEREQTAAVGVVFSHHEFSQIENCLQHRSAAEAQRLFDQAHRPRPKLDPPRRVPGGGQRPLPRKAVLLLQCHSLLPFAAARALPSMPSDSRLPPSEPAATIRRNDPAAPSAQALGWVRAIELAQAAPAAPAAPAARAPPPPDSPRRGMDEAAAAAAELAAARSVIQRAIDSSSPPSGRCSLQRAHAAGRRGAGGGGGEGAERAARAVCGHPGFLLTFCGLLASNSADWAHSDCTLFRRREGLRQLLAQQNDPAATMVLSL